MFERGAACTVLLMVASAAQAAETPVHDPMQPYRVGVDVPAAVRSPQFRLTAVLIAASRRVATLNGKPHVVGDRLEGAELVRIERDHVVLKHGDQETSIHLGSARDDVPH